MRSPFTRQFLAVSLLSACAIAVRLANACTISCTYTDCGQVTTYDRLRSDISDVMQFAYGTKVIWRR